MGAHRPLLLELGCEELPPKALDELAAAFAEGLRAGLAQAGVLAPDCITSVFHSPRRLAVHLSAVAGLQSDQDIERRGPAVSAGLDAGGAPTKALLGFARSCGVEPAALERVATDKGEWFVWRSVQPGRTLAALLPEILAATIRAMPIPRPMRWGDHDYSFVRPVHWLVVLHGPEVVDIELLGLRSGRLSHGHRFHHPQPVHVADADGWLEALRSAHVLADPAERRERVRAEVSRVAAGGTPRLSASLLGELANLNEWPVGIACTFDRDFLRVPPEALVTTMEANQKFVPVFSADGELTPHFVGIANVDSKDPAQIRAGYERVIRPRFADARFFYEEDLKTPLADLQQQLAGVTWQQALGSTWDKSCRVAELARVIAGRVGVDAGLATRAASLAKCDLLTRMVGEFPELQGTMGYWYAKAQGEAPEVALAIDEAYQPRHSGDPIAREPLSRVLAVAERLDTLAGIFAVGMKPTGSKDPFALRRAALGLARTLVEGGMELDLRASFIEALELLPEAALLAGAPDAAGSPPSAAARRAALLEELLEFVFDRLRAYYAEQRFSVQEFAAVHAVAPATLPDFDRRLRAVAAFARLPEAANLAAANKRVGNILDRLDPAMPPAREVDSALLLEPAEQALAAALAEHGGQSRAACHAGDYAGALHALAVLQPEVDRFFEEVLVLAEDPAVRGNRLALLARLRAAFLAVADIARLQGTPAGSTAH